MKRHIATLTSLPFVLVAQTAGSQEPPSVPDFTTSDHSAGERLPDSAIPDIEPPLHLPEDYDAPKPLHDDELGAHETLPFNPDNSLETIQAILTGVRDRIPPEVQEFLEGSTTEFHVGFNFRAGLPQYPRISLEISDLDCQAVREAKDALQSYFEKTPSSNPMELTQQHAILGLLDVLSAEKTIALDNLEDLFLAEERFAEFNDGNAVPAEFKNLLPVVALNLSCLDAT